MALRMVLMAMMAPLAFMCWWADSYQLIGVVNKKRQSGPKSRVGEFRKVQACPMVERRKRAPSSLTGFTPPRDITFAC